MDAPPALARRDGQETTARGGSTVSVHPLLGPHVRLQEEPERHVWQGEVGTAAQPWLADHQIRNVAVLPGAAYCEMALGAAHAVLGEAAEVRDIRFEQRAVIGRAHHGRRLGSSRITGRRRFQRGNEPRTTNRRGKLPLSCMPPRTICHLRTTCRRCLPRTRP